MGREVNSNRDTTKSRLRLGEPPESIQFRDQDSRNETYPVLAAICPYFVSAVSISRF